MPDSSAASPWRKTLAPFLPTRRAWLSIAVACAAGVLLFALLWLGKRGDAVDADADVASEGPPGRALAPLPAPLPAALEGIDEVDTAPPPGTPVRIDAHVAPAAPAQAPPLASADTSAPTPAPGVDTPATGDRDPRPISSPPPSYPRAAMRRGEAGEVLLRVHVGANGRTTAVDVVRSSQSARLDRAATAAVQRWRFEPAIRGGQAVAGEVLVPFEFTPPR
ncbi:energy transducer TonB [Luteimonas sp. BDR2-5]|uniref:energy transducer TonB n=1 Tax=Proluteimonas luteida TaxID=2878685 RepID=UPI001E32DB94|nr:energy transducer TonB [Luteimonas sp. BDR2-5]MCD9026864.1 energy transducer TonB [Luteimonas sp. BDR2-5]